MYADAVAISKMAAKIGKSEDANLYIEKSTSLRKNINTMLWDEDSEFYKTLSEKNNYDFADVREEIGYLRLSKEDDSIAVASNSIINQEKMIRMYIDDHDDLVFKKKYEDDGVSGSGFDRPGFNEMMRDVDAGKIDCIIVKGLSRFGRNHYECDRYMQVIFPQKGIRFIAITDHYDSNNETSETDMFLIPIKNIMNDNYCRDMSLKIRTQLETKRKLGECVKNFAPYGYIKDPNDKHKLIIDEYAAFVVKEIFFMKLKGYSVNSIVDELNERGIRSPSEYKKSQNSKYTATLQRNSVAKWCTTEVRHILTDMNYCGSLVQGRITKPTFKCKKSKPVDKEKWIVVEDTHEAIISRAHFKAVERLLEIETRIPPSQKMVYPLSGMVRCGKCGGKMISRFGRNHLEAAYYIYKFFPQYNTRFIAINDDYDSLKGNTALEDILLPIKNLINENYARETSRKVGTTARNNINKGLFISAFAPFGYKKSKTKVGRLEVDEEVAHIVRRVFDMFTTQDMSTVEISRQLNDEGIISPAQYKIKNGLSKNQRWANAVWNTHTVKMMLANPLYIGTLVLGKTRVDMYRNEPLRITKQEERNVVPNAHEAIVSADVFKMTQKKLKEKKRGPITYRRNVPYIFNNLYCGCCGAKLVKQYRLDSTGKISLIFYSCPSDSRGMQTHCVFKKINEDELAEIVYKSLQLYVCMAVGNKKEFLDAKPKPLREYDEDITRYTHIIENIEVLQTNVFDDFGSGKITGIEYNALVEGYKEKQEHYKLLLEDLKVSREKYLTDRLERQSWVKKLLQFEKDTQLTREMVDELIERINLSGQNKIEIIYKFKNLFEDVLLNGGVCVG